MSSQRAALVVRTPRARGFYRPAPRWTAENRQFVDKGKTAISRRRDWCTDLLRISWRRQRRICVDIASRPLEYPHIVLIAASAAKLFRGSKATPTVLQFVSKGNCHLAARNLDSRRGH
jgi:hypothetical protein